MAMGDLRVAHRWKLSEDLVGKRAAITGGWALSSGLKADR